jgi:DNA-binding winged helix-turn-helix (wHTH) protein
MIAKAKTYVFGDFRFVPSESLLLNSGEAVSLPHKALNVLEKLVESAGSVVTKDDLLRDVWDDLAIEESAVPRTVFLIRAALGDDPKNHTFIQTVPKRGYRFVTQVSTLNGWNEQAIKDEPIAGELPVPDIDVQPVSTVKPRRFSAVQLATVLFLLAAATTGAYLGFFSNAAASNKAFTSLRRPTDLNPQAVQSVTQSKRYWEMTENEQLEFIRERANEIEMLIGDFPRAWNDDSLQSIKTEIDSYVERKDSLSQEAFKDGLRVIFGRSSQYAPLITETFERHHVPPAIGLYQAMIESEYRDCLVNELGNTGLFQFTRRTAAKYGLSQADQCSVKKQADVAAKFESDLLSDFGTERSSWTLALLSFNQGGEITREQLRELRERGVTERSFWVIFENRLRLQSGLDDHSQQYLPRFYAVAIIGETPSAFDLLTPALTTLR